MFREVTAAKNGRILRYCQLATARLPQIVQVKIPSTGGGHMDRYRIHISRYDRLGTITDLY
jgi:hypothetical protein